MPDQDALRRFNADFDAIVARHGDRLALIPVAQPGRELSYHALDVLIDRQLAAFVHQGLRPGDCVGALMPNSVEQLVLFLACLRGGLRFAPLACDITGEEIRQWARVMRPAHCYMGALIDPAVQTAVRALGAPTTSVVADGAFAHLAHGAADAAAVRADGAKLLLLTSGTTGQPKAIVIDGDRLWSAGWHFLRSYGLDEDTPLRIWNYLPHSYLGGLFNLALIPFAAAGSAVVDETFSGKTFLAFWQTIDRYDIDTLWLVPAIVRGLLAIGERTERAAIKSYRDTIRRAFLGTAPIELAAKRRFEALFGISLLENFALSETTFITAEHPGEDALRSEGSTGAVLPYVALRLRPVADEGDDDPHYHEILVRSPYLADGYLDSDGHITRPDDDGYFPTGDLGYLSPQGQLVLTGRSRDIIKKGGHFVALREIERIAAAHPAVSEAAAVTTRHPFYGESYKLCVCLRPDAPADALAAVSEHVYARVARYKWPEDIEAVSAFPRTSSGKIRKFLLAAQTPDAAEPPQ